VANVLALVAAFLFALAAALQQKGIGVFLLDETLSRPAWHVVLAVGGLALALVGAVVISLAREAAKSEGSERAGDAVVATA
jgi:hypothetical protein